MEKSINMGRVECQSGNGKKKPDTENNKEWEGRQ